MVIQLYYFGDTRDFFALLSVQLLRGKNITHWYENEVLQIADYEARENLRYL